MNAHQPSVVSRFAVFLVALAALAAACGGDTEPATTIATTTTTTTTANPPAETTEPPGTSVVPSDYLGSYTLVDDGYGTMVAVTVDGSTRTIETNALPDHDTGEFPNAGNPNSISAQSLTWEFPATGTFVGNATQVRTSGVAVNGVKFEPATAETATCATGETYRIEALQDLYDLGLDFNNAHVQPTGEYHYHGISELLVDAYDAKADLVHIGFASDGYLMYYSKSSAYASSYVLSDQPRSGTDCALSGPFDESVDLEGTSPDGTYSTDYVYVEGAGDLDSCNGTMVDGEYAYIVTNEYPFVSRCLNGEPAADAGAGGGGGPGP